MTDKRRKVPCCRRRKLRLTVCDLLEEFRMSEVPIKAALLALLQMQEHEQR